MLSCALSVFLAFTSLVSSRETIRSMPTISNSLVNLGKMEISFYFNGNGRDSRAPIRPFMFPNSQQKSAIDEPCSCANYRNMKDSLLRHPTGLLNKILSNNNLFSFHQDPATSTLCCASHESTQESTVVLEFPNNSKNIKPFGSRSNIISGSNNVIPIPNNPMALPMMPFIFDSLGPNKSMYSPLKTKSIEIFLFPKKKEVDSDIKSKLLMKKDLTSKDNIQIVGDKELKDNIRVFKPELPVVKKDLNIQEKNEKEQNEKDSEKENEKEGIEKEGGDRIIIEPAGQPNTL